jgi:hypothetical protein
VTAENGSFTIEGIPAGSYDIEIWHEILGIKKARVSVSEGAAIFLEPFTGGSRDEIVGFS